MRLFFITIIAAFSLNVYGQVPDYLPTEGVVAWYPFNGNANDESGNGNDGNPQDIVLASDRFGVDASAANFNGVSSHISISLTSISNQLTETTVNLWVKTNDSHSPLFACSGSGGFELALNIGTLADILVQPGHIGVFVRDVCCGTGNNGFGSNIIDNTWHMITLVRYMNGSNKIYVDAELDLELPAVNGGNLILDPTYMALGAQLNWISGGPSCGSCNSPDQQRLNGIIDDVAVWNTTLSAPQIQLLYSYDGASDVGCTDSVACNYNPDAIEDDGSCDYTCCPGPGCCNIGMIWNWEIGICETSIPTDTNLDGCTDLNDLMDLLGAYGICGQPEFAACGDLVSHEGYDYSTVQIGDQCWFSENCRYLPSVSPSNEGNDTDPYYYVYDYQGTDIAAAQATANYDTYGTLYNWPAVMTEGICPSGWHIPTDGEFTELTDFLGGEDVAGGKMKEAGYDHWYSPNTGATNSSGFTGLPGGFRYSGGFGYDGGNGSWWSASESGSYSWTRLLDNSFDSVSRYINARDDGFSARCVRD